MLRRGVTGAQTGVARLLSKKSSAREAQPLLNRTHSPALVAAATALSFVRICKACLKALLAGALGADRRHYAVSR